MSILEQWQQRLLYKSTYAGVPTIKAPTDFWIYQEIVYQYKPEVIIEIGNHKGGMLIALTHWMRDILRFEEYYDEYGLGIIYGIDIDHSTLDSRVFFEPRISLIEGDAISVSKHIHDLIPPITRVIIIEDSSHTYENTLGILNAYQDLIQINGYFIIEDTICHHGLNTGPNPGPMEAVEEFLRLNKDFVSDRSREEFELTWNPKGYLKRVSYGL